MDGTDLRERFAQDGFVRLAGGFPAGTAESMAGAVWAELERRHGIERERRSTWTVADPRGLGALRKRGVFDAMATAEVTAAIGQLLGYPSWPRPGAWGVPLVTFPTPGSWDVPSSGWHLDYPARSALTLKWLGYLAPVGERGGGTVVLAGSHWLVERFLDDADPADPGRSPAVRDAVFGSDPWLRDLLRPGGSGGRVERLTRGTTIAGVPVRVVELTGRPGDVVFLHPHLFHAPAANRSAAPRLMITGGLDG
ncbi:phytanoyl-CoA dioxygenase family protein [Actinomadura sp. 3N508]|uniref:phytanoyl-CoA dioxygenase family protein n=1 Tax=Actinomadura sp. 3N508 TaxID=3375153 RepID=UPI0037A9E497